MNRIFNVEITKKGLPAMWESGGGCTKTGEAIVISDKQGLPKVPIFIRSGGHLANLNHALFIVDIGDIVVRTIRHSDEYTVELFRICSFDKQKEVVHAILEAEYSKGEWNDEEIPIEYNLVIDASKEKTLCWHCKHVHYRKGE